MTESEFLILANNYLTSIETLAEKWIDADIDVDCTRQGNVLTLDFNGQQVVLNIQTPMKELWLASKSGAYHYTFDGSTWINTRAGKPDLNSELTQVCSSLSGEHLKI
ncbi:iron donor protein CyaY [Taylorella equigenitalis]|uniref:iron donor protein CyaY n=1 Tax=Taylorella equigenitalis TaxID=29575 RepID=UPI00030CA931|nr:iron donor protein CyaY [Taylorella equigenitalis]ASY39941.1 iron donor protein CyaY [Taylorella equigenitalis]VEG32669.1 frataxin-like protein [Taylorella equigenitalis ATCC 35865]